jgi:hypothetical protein
VESFGLYGCVEGLDVLRFAKDDSKDKRNGHGKDNCKNEQPQEQPQIPTG